MKLMTTILLLFVFASTSFANITDTDKKGTKKEAAKASYTLTGSVIDEDNLEGLIGATITIVETGTVLYTDFDGNFTLPPLPFGDYTLHISMVSYKELKIKNLTLKKDTELNVLLHSH